MTSWVSALFAILHLTYCHVLKNPSLNLLVTMVTYLFQIQLIIRESRTGRSASGAQLPGLRDDPVVMVIEDGHVSMVLAGSVEGVQEDDGWVRDEDALQKAEEQRLQPQDALCPSKTGKYKTKDVNR